MKNKEEFKKVIYSAIKKVLDTDEVAIADDETFDDYGIDSLDKMNLLLELEQILGKELGEIDLEEINTINLLFEHIGIGPE